MAILSLNAVNKYYSLANGDQFHALKDINLDFEAGELVAIVGESGSGDSDIMMTDTINPLKSKFKGFHKTFKQDDLGLSLSSFLLN